MTAHFEILKHPHQGLAAVKHGFSWPAALLGWGWALARHLWIPGVLLLGVHAALAVTTVKLFAENPGLLLVVGVGLQVWFGSQGNYFLTRSLQERGFLYLGLVPASSPADAIAKFKAVGEAIPAEWRTGTVPVAFSLPASWQQLLAVAQLTIKAVVRYRLLPVLAGLLLVVVVCLPLVLKHDGTARGLVQIVITYCLSAVTAILGLVTLWLSTGTLARDVEDCSMQMVAVKPIARWRIWLGKWLGIMALNLVLLGLSGLAIFFLIQWRAASLPDKQQAILKNELLLARGSLTPPPPDLDGKVEEVLKARLKELGPSATGADLATVRRDVKEMLKAQFQVVPPRMGRTWVIDTGLAHRQLLNTPIYLRIKFRSSQYSVKPETYGTMWEIGPPKSDKRIRISRPLTTDTFHEFGINLLDEKGNPVSEPVRNGGYANLIDQDGKLYITFGNPNQAALLFDFVEGIEVLYHEGGFGLNFTRGAGIIFIWLGLLAAIGLAGASYLSFPVAAFFSITVLIVGLSSSTIATVVQDGTFGSTNHDTGAKEGVLGAVDFVMVPIFQGANEILTMVNSFSPIDSLSTGRSVSWTTLATALFQIWGLIGGCFAVVGMIIFQRRELATAQGRG
ncbi:MAG: hypothetical protein B9S33_08100 [Pedosphaera sp. Tous-C6FEB]|nr:MAG: hypothetical protein B9S33_08100 [Pedosphaera sp. Tous-C6FEB]